MFTAIISIHILVCALLILVILIQRGRGGGLVETFSDVESMFGTKTNTFLSRMTTILAILFLSSCLILAFLSAKRSKSLLEGVFPNKLEQSPKSQAEPIKVEEAPRQSSPINKGDDDKPKAQ